MIIHYVYDTMGTMGTSSGAFPSHVPQVMIDAVLVDFINHTHM